MPNPKAVHPKERCPECGSDFSSQYITTHRRTKHGVRGGKSGWGRKTASTALVHVPRESTNHHRKRVITALENFEVLTDGERFGIVEWLP
jgi:hypothetical protein